MSKKTLEKRICPYCKKEFTPNHARRKYCSDTHRVNDFNRRKGFKVTRVAPEEQEYNNVSSDQNESMQGPVNPKPITKEGVSEAMLGYGAVDLAKSVFTPDRNKPATKGFVIDLIQELDNNNERRYQEILRRLNLNQDNNKKGIDISHIG